MLNVLICTQISDPEKSEMNINFKFKLGQMVYAKYNGRSELVEVYTRHYSESFANTTHGTIRVSYEYVTSLGRFREEQLTEI